MEVGTIIRVDDIEAEAKVKSGYYKYVPKSEFKSIHKEVSLLIGKELAEMSDQTITISREETISEKQLKRGKKTKVK